MNEIKLACDMQEEISSCDIDDMEMKHFYVLSLKKVFR
jgi:hypothetical protein